MKNPVVRRIFFVYLGMLVAVALFFLALLWRSLVMYQTNYEDEQQVLETLKNAERAPQRTFLQFAEQLTAAELSNLWLEDNQNAPESELTVTSYFTDLLSSEEIGYYKSRKSTKKAPVFEIFAGESPLARVYLTGAGSKWEVEDVRVFANGKEEFTCCVPEGTIVSLNGKELGGSYADKTGIVKFPYDRERDLYKDLLKNEVMWTKVRVDGLLSVPEYEITAKEGEIISKEEIPDTSGGFYILYADEDLTEKLTGVSEGFLNAYLTYYTYGKNMIDDHIAKAQSYCFANSPADKSLINAYEDSVSWAYGHTNLRNEILDEGRPVKWADNCYSVDIKYHAYAKRGGEELDYSRQDELIRIVMLDKGNGYKVYAFDVSPAGEFLE